MAVLFEEVFSGIFPKIESHPRHVSRRTNLISIQLDIILKKYI